MILEEKGDTGFAKSKLTWSLIWQGVLRTSNEKCFCRCISHKGETTENVSPLLNGAGDLVTGNREHAEVFSIFSIASFLLTMRSQVHGTCLEYRRLIHPQERKIEEHKLDWTVHGSWWGTSMSVQGARQCLCESHSSFSLKECGIWEKENVIAAFRKGKEENTGNYSLVIFDLIPVRVRDQTAEEITSRHVKEKKVVGNSQCELRKENHASPI